MEIQTSEKSQALTDKKVVKVLLVEDGVIDRKLVERILAKNSKPVEFTLEFAESLSAAIEQLSNNKKYDIILLDPMLPDSRGIETIQKLKLVIPDTPIVVLTGMGDEEMGLSAIRNGASDYLVKNLPLNILLVRTIIYTLERRKTIEALAQSESTFRTLVEHIPQKIFIKDKNSVYLFSNHNYAQDLKIKPEEIVGKTDYDFYPEELAEKYRADDKRIIKTGETEDIEEKYIENGEERCVHTVKTPYKDAKGNIIGVLGIFRDITERKRAVDKIKSLAEEWQKTFDSISDLVFIQDKDFNIIRANKAFTEAMKSKLEDIIGKKCYEVMHNRDSPWPDCPFEKSRVDKKPHTEEINDPHIGIPFLVSAFPIFDDNGEFTGSVHIAKDITKQKKATELLFDTNLRLQETSQNLFNAKKELEKKNAALRKNQESLGKQVEERTSELIDANKTLQNAETNLRIMINQNADGILIIDHKGIIRFVNNAAESLFGRKKEELIGEAFGFAAVKDEITEIEVIQKGGEVVTAEMRTVEIKWEGEMVYLASLRDITERKKAEEKLKETMRMKSKFTSMVAHELRSPLGSIKEGINLVLEGLAGNINDEQRDLLDTAKRNTDRLGRLINNVLDFQKMESGKMGVDIRKNDINEAVLEVNKAMSLLATEKGLDLVADVDDSIPKVRFDKDRIVQVLTNLVSNAVKYTEKGNITISTKQEDDTVHVIVQDTGMGIKAEDMEKLFCAFEQLDSTRDKKKGGTGLGLAISKEIILAHKGKIWAESEAGKGSAFHFTIPKKLKEKKKIGEILVEEGKITEEDLKKALENQQKQEVVYRML